MIAGGITSSGKAADVTCFPSPIPFDLRFSVSPQPQPDASIGCGSPLPCLAPAAPAVSEWTPTQARPLELKLVSTPLDPVSGYQYVVVWAQRFNDSDQSWQDLYTVISKDSVDYAKIQSASTVEYGAVGLLPGARYRFRTAWCRVAGTANGCGCFPTSAGFVDVERDRTVDPRPSVFADPALPYQGGVVRKALDDFERPPTTPKRNRDNSINGGDGLGVGMWQDDLGSGASVIGNGAFIAEAGGERFGVIPFNSIQSFLPLSATRPHSFAELQFRPYCTSSKPNPPSNTTCNQSLAKNYRVDVQTRVVLLAGTAYSYLAQIRYEPEWDGTEQTTEPYMRIIRTGAGLGTPLLGGTGGERIVATPASDGAVGCEFDGIARKAESTDIAGLKDSSPKLLRIRVKNGPSGYPEVHATIAWNLVGGTFKNQCTYLGGDSTLLDTHPLFSANGGRSYFVHHWDARSDLFAAGDRP
jgi:hypothetical protein